MFHDFISLLQESHFLEVNKQIVNSTPYFSFIRTCTSGAIALPFTVPLVSVFFFIQKTVHYRVLQLNAVFYKNGRSDTYCPFILDFIVKSLLCYCRNMNRKWILK